MKKHIALFALSIASFLTSTEFISAAVINTIDTNNDSQWNVYKVENWQTFGNTMDGMQVTATFGNGSETKTWEDTSGAVGTGWSLVMQYMATANTWFDYAWWILTNNTNSPITSLVIDGRPGNTVFDIILDDSDEYSPGSENGRAAVANSDISPYLNVDVLYSTQVTVKGTFYDDLYQTVTFDFSSTGYPSAGLQPGHSFWFALDTDNVNPVPEPATMLLFGIGAMGIAAFRKRKTV